MKNSLEKKTKLLLTRKLNKETSHLYVPNIYAEGYLASKAFTHVLLRGMSCSILKVTCGVRRLQSLSYVL